MSGEQGDSIFNPVPVLETRLEMKTLLCVVCLVLGQAAGAFVGVYLGLKTAKFIARFFNWE